MIQKLIENLPAILVGVAAVLMALSYLISTRAKANPGKTWEDSYAPILNNVKDSYLQAIEWIGAVKGWKGTEKLGELLRETHEIEVLCAAGKKSEALMRASAYYFDAQRKAEKAGISPLAGGSVLVSSQASGEIKQVLVSAPETSGPGSK